VSAETHRCGFVFNVDAAPVGDGVLLSANRRTLIVQKRPHELANRKCLAAWASKHHLKVRYVPVPR
jgi:hypothetical protein